MNEKKKFNVLCISLVLFICLFAVSCFYSNIFIVLIISVIVIILICTISPLRKLLVNLSKEGFSIEIEKNDSDK